MIMSCEPEALIRALAQLLAGAPPETRLDLQRKWYAEVHQKCGKSAADFAILVHSICHDMHDAGRTNMNNQTEPGTSTPAASHAPAYVWITALVLTVLLIGFLILAYFFTPNMTDDQRFIARQLFALLAGLAALFLGGSALLTLDFPQNKYGKLAFSATAGIAVFAFVYMKQPYWFVSPPTPVPVTVPATGTGSVAP